MRSVGASETRIDIRTKVQGSRKYPQDFNMPGQLWARVVWSEHPHAMVRRIDASEASALPGVVRVITHRDVPVNRYGINDPDQPVLVAEGDKVRWVGDRIALVVAETDRIAARAASMVRVEYDPLPVVEDPRAAMQPGAPLVHEGRPGNVLHRVRIRHGHVDAGFALADEIIEGEFHTPAVEHAYMQPEAGISYIDSEGRVTVNVATQWPHDDVRQIAGILNLPQERVREIVPAVGGAFGGREDMYIQHLLALSAFIVRRPVKMVWDRETSVTRSGKRHPFYMRYRMGATRDGMITAAQVELVSDAGAYASTSVPVLNNAATFAVGPYSIPNAAVDACAVHTNNAVTMAMRGFGATQPPVCYESMMDRMAARLGMDPVELRLQNLLADGRVCITGNVMGNRCAVQETLRMAADAAGWRREGGHWSRPDLGAPSAPYKRRGIGVACAYKNVAYSLGFDDKSAAEVDLNFQPDGRIVSALVKTAAVDVGQGVTTVLSQIAADALGIGLAQVRVALVDTVSTPDAGSSSASRHTFSSGNAVLGACRAALARRDEALRADPAASRVSAEFIYHCRDTRPTSYFAPETGQCNPHVSYSFGTEIALVEVDVETGETEILKMWAAHNAGRVVNPAGYFGQVAGGIHMGVGYALTEDYVQARGRPRSRRFSEYTLPTVLDMPGELDSMVVDVPEPGGPFGATGVGETPTLPTAPAILNAIHDATGAWLDQLPATGEAVWRAMRRQAP